MFRGVVASCPIMLMTTNIQWSESETDFNGLIVLAKVDAVFSTTDAISYCRSTVEGHGWSVK